MEVDTTIIMLYPFKNTMIGDYINNPETQKPIKIGSRVYNKLVRQGIISPDEYPEALPAPRKPGRPRKTKKADVFVLGDVAEEPEPINEDLMRRVAKSAVTLARKDHTNFEDLDADEIMKRLQQMIMDELDSD